MPFSRSIVRGTLSPIMNRGGNLIGANPCAGLPLWLSTGAFHLMTAAADREAYPTVAYTDYASATAAASLPFVNLVQPVAPFSQFDYVSYAMADSGTLTNEPLLQLYVSLNVMPFWRRVLAVCGVTQIPASSGPVMTVDYARALPASTSNGSGVFRAAYVLVSPSLDSTQWDRWWSVG